MEWSLQPAIFKISTFLGVYELRWYSILFATGFLISYLFLIQKIYRDEGKPMEDADSLLFYSVIATVIGARLGHVIFYEPHWITQDPLQIFKVWEGGLASHGAAIALPFALWIFSKVHPSQPFLWVLDRVCLCTAFTGSLIRVGNFCNSELIGTPTDVPWGVKFLLVDNVARHPVQLYEAFGYFIIFLVMLFIYRKYKDKTPHGLLSGIFLLTVFSHRIAMEFFKTTQSQYLIGSPLDMGQILSIPVVLVGIFLIYYSLNHPVTATPAAKPAKKAK